MSRRRLCWTVLPVVFAVLAACAYAMILSSSTRPDLESFWKDFLVGKIHSRHEGSVTVLAFSPDGGKLASCGGLDKIISIWDIDSREEVACLEGHGAAVASLAFSTEGSILASGDWNSQVRIWDSNNWGLVDCKDGRCRAPAQVAISWDNGLLAFGPYQKPSTILLWDLKKREIVKSLQLNGGPPWGLVFPSHNEDLVSLTGNTSISLLDIETGRVLRNNPGPGPALGLILWHMVSDRNQGLLAIHESFRSEVSFWNAKEGRRVGSLEEHWENVADIAFSPDGTLLATVGGGGHEYPGELRLWDVESRKCLAHIRPVSKFLESVAFSPNGKTLATGGRMDGVIRLWSVDRILKNGLKEEVGPGELRGR